MGLCTSLFFFPVDMEADFFQQSLVMFKWACHSTAITSSLAVLVTGLRTKTRILNIAIVQVDIEPTPLNRTCRLISALKMISSTWKTYSSVSPVMENYWVHKVKFRKYTCTAKELHWPTIRLFFPFWMRIHIESLLLNMEINIFLVCKISFTRKLTFYILVNLTLIRCWTKS